VTDGPVRQHDSVEATLGKFVDNFFDSHHRTLGGKHGFLLHTEHAFLDATRGLDVGSIEFIHRRLVEMRDKGCAILLVSSELEEVTALADRLLVIRGGKIANYHPYPPTPWNANPRDVYGTPGPYEDAVQNTPIFEENDKDNFKGIDIMRTVRSFDPCLPCGVHMYLGDGRVIEERHSPTLLNLAE